MTKHKIEATAFRHFKKAQRLQYKLHLTPEEEIEMLKEYEIIIKKYPNTQWAAEAFYGLGLYYEGRDFDKALYYYQKCVQKFENRSATSIIIAHAYRNIGDLFFGWLNNYQKAIKNYKKAIRCMKIYLENPLNDERDYMQLGSLQRSLGLTYERLKDYKNALKEFENAKISFEKANYPAALIEAKNIVSDIERVKRKLMFGNK
jgi:tetratricopeptide (TPR) repeat protein